MHNTNFTGNGYFGYRNEWYLDDSIYQYSPGAAAQSHTPLMSHLRKSDVHAIMDYLQRRDPLLCSVLTQNARRLWIAGGFIATFLQKERFNDIDIFGYNKWTVLDAAKSLCVSCSDRNHTMTPCTVTVSGPVADAQFVLNNVYQSVAHCLDGMDYTVCQAGIWYTGKRWDSVCSRTFYHDLQARRLRYSFPRRIETPNRMLGRLRKYLDKGYTMMDADRIDFMHQLESIIPTARDGLSWRDSQ